MKNWRRFEILLPLRFNDGKKVPKALLAQTVQELEDRFGAASAETQILHGRWRPKGRASRDDLIRIYVDAQQPPEVQACFRDFRERAEPCSQQRDLWLTSPSTEALY